MSKASQEQLILVLADIVAQGYDLSIEADKTAIYNHIAGANSSYLLTDDTTISNISIKFLFYLYNNNQPVTKLPKKK